MFSFTCPAGGVSSPFFYFFFMFSVFFFLSVPVSRSCWTFQGQLGAMQPQQRPITICRHTLEGTVSHVVDGIARAWGLIGADSLSYDDQSKGVRWHYRWVWFKVESGCTLMRTSCSRGLYTFFCLFSFSSFFGPHAFTQSIFTAAMVLESPGTRTHTLTRGSLLEEFLSHSYSKLSK